MQSCSRVKLIFLVASSSIQNISGRLVWSLKNFSPVVTQSTTSVTTQKRKYVFFYLLIEKTNKQTQKRNARNFGEEVCLGRKLAFWGTLVVQLVGVPCTEAVSSLQRPLWQLAAFHPFTLPLLLPNPSVVLSIKGRKRPKTSLKTEEKGKAAVLIKAKCNKAQRRQTQMMMNMKNEISESIS